MRRLFPLLVAGMVVMSTTGCRDGSSGSSNPPVPGPPTAPDTAIITLQCEGEERLSLGCFSEPFDEPRVGGAFPDQNNRSAENPFKDIPDDGRCEENEDGVLKCKPAAGSVALLADGRVLYFNALEGTENVEFSIFFEAGSALINDQTRLMRFHQGGASWSQPEPVDGGANPDGNNSTVLLPGDTAGDRTNNDGALFCSDLVQLPNGEILAVGGTDYYHEPGVSDPFPFGISELEGLRNARIFSPADNSWRQTDSMHFGRWYPTAISLASGDVFVASGVTKLVKPVYMDAETSGRNVTATETYNVCDEVWAINGPLAERSLPLYPRLHLLPNGHVYYNAAGQSFNPFGQAYDQALWNIAATYDPQNATWSDLAYAGLPLQMNDAGLEALVSVLNPTTTDEEQVQNLLQSAAETLLDDPAALLGPLLDDPNPSLAVETAIGAGFRGSTFSIMLPLTPDDSGRYRQAEFLTAGGVLGAVAANSPGSYFATDLSRIDTVAINDDGALTYRSRLTQPLSQPRWYSTGVLLPNGQVMVFSGADRDEVAMPGSAMSILQAEVFDPATESWTPMATQTRERTYHNTAMLLPDGSVLVGGHAPINTAYSYSVTLPGFSPNDGRDPSFEIYFPPYWFMQRPEIISASNSATHGERINITVPGSGADIDSVVLVRRTSLTHLLDADQRSVVLPIEQRSAGQLMARIPDNPALLPPGEYMLFVNAAGEAGPIPSESTRLIITGALACSSMLAGG